MPAVREGECLARVIMVNHELYLVLETPDGATQWPGSHLVVITEDEWDEYLRHLQERHRWADRLQDLLVTPLKGPKWAIVIDVHPGYDPPLKVHCTSEALDENGAWDYAREQAARAGHAARVDSVKRLRD